MPGAYAHLTIAGLVNASNILNSEPSFPQAAKADLLDNACFCDLGAISPDYPYLHLTSPSSAAWADHMHYTDTCAMLVAGVEEVQKLSGYAKSKAVAWLMGYAAHLVTDATIHPIVELRVGPYAQNKTAHRVCEMHQDAHIFQRLQVGTIDLPEYLDSSIRSCSSLSAPHKLDEDIAATWRTMLNACYPAQYKADKPTPDSWHAAFMAVTDTVEEKIGLLPFSRHVALNAGLTYPTPKEIDPQYIQELKTPEGPMPYDAIFDRALHNVVRMWTALSSAIYTGETRYLAMIGAWDLDTGRDSHNKLVYWRNEA